MVDKARSLLCSPLSRNGLWLYGVRATCAIDREQPLELACAHFMSLRVCLQLSCSFEAKKGTRLYAARRLLKDFVQRVIAETGNMPSGDEANSHYSEYQESMLTEWANQSGGKPRRLLNSRDSKKFGPFRHTGADCEVCSLLHTHPVDQVLVDLFLL